MKKTKLFTLAFAALFGLGAATGCGTAECPECPVCPDDPGTNPPVTEVAKVNFGFHSNFGSALGYIADAEGYFEDEYIDPQVQILTGPNVIVGLQTGTLDVGFLGNGVSWNYFLEDSPIKLFCIDNVTNDDRLLAKAGGKGDGLSEASSNAELREALKGSTVALDLTATPATFLKNLVTKLNEGLADSQKIWFRDSANNVNYPELSTYTPANEIGILQTSNANLVTAMSGNDAPDFCVPFSNIAIQLQNTEGFEVVGTTLGRELPVTPSNWAVRADWVEENPEVFQRVCNALVDAMDVRANDPERAVEIVANANRVDVSQFADAPNLQVSPTVQQQYDWFLNGQNLEYVEAIRNSHFGAGHDPVLEASEVVEFYPMLKACAEHLGL